MILAAKGIPNGMINYILTTSMGSYNHFQHGDWETLLQLVGWISDAEVRAHWNIDGAQIECYQLRRRHGPVTLHPRHDCNSSLTVLLGYLLSVVCRQSQLKVQLYQSKTFQRISRLSWTSGVNSLFKEGGYPRSNAPIDPST